MAETVLEVKYERTVEKQYHKSVLIVLGVFLFAVIISLSDRKQQKAYSSDYHKLVFAMDVGAGTYYSLTRFEYNDAGRLVKTSTESVNDGYTGQAFTTYTYVDLC